MDSSEYLHTSWVEPTTLLYRYAQNVKIINVCYWITYYLTEICVYSTIDACSLQRSAERFQFLTYFKQRTSRALRWFVSAVAAPLGRIRSFAMLRTRFVVRPREIPFVTDCAFERSAYSARTHSLSLFFIKLQFLLLSTCKSMSRYKMIRSLMEVSGGIHF